MGQGWGFRGRSSGSRVGRKGSEFRVDKEDVGTRRDGRSVFAECRASTKMRSLLGELDFTAIAGRRRLVAGNRNTWERDRLGNGC